MLVYRPSTYITKSKLPLIACKWFLHFLDKILDRWAFQCHCTQIIHLSINIIPEFSCCIFNFSSSCFSLKCWAMMTLLWSLWSFFCFYASVIWKLFISHHYTLQDIYIYTWHLATEHRKSNCFKTYSPTLLSDHPSTQMFDEISEKQDIQ